MNLFDIPKGDFKEEIITSLIENKNVEIKRIISKGHKTQWYDQDKTEFVCLIQGNAKLEFDEGRTIELNCGDTLIIYPHERHRVVFTSSNPPCVWLCVFF